jgi:hypothetical protein
VALRVQNLVAQPICLDEKQEKRLIIFVIAHTDTLGAAAIILDWDDHPLLSRRRNYQIPTPPPGHYQGPVLTREEILAWFETSLVPPAPTPEQNKSLLDSANVTFMLPGSPARTFPLAQLPP